MLDEEYLASQSPKEAFVSKRPGRLLCEIALPIIASLAMLVAVQSWAGPAEDEALRNAAGCSFDHIDIQAVKTALNRGADPNAPPTPNKRFSPLGCIVLLTYSGNPDAVADRKAIQVARILFDAGAKLGPGDDDILFFPISAGSVGMVRLLINKGASPTAKLEGFTPNELAKKYNQLAVYDYLISRGGIPINSQAAAQITLIELAGTPDMVARGRDDDVRAAKIIAEMELAIGQGARINSLGPDNRTALIAAVRTPIYVRSQAVTIQWLLDHGADPNQKGDSGFEGVEGLPLHIFVAMNKNTLAGVPRRPAAKAMAEETMARLLKAGAKVSGMDSQGRTPLHVAAISDDVRAAEILINEGAKIMARDTTGKTPLDYAESAPMIKLLKANGATEH